MLHGHACLREQGADRLSLRLLAVCLTANQSVRVHALKDSPAPMPMKPRLPPPKPQPTPKPQPAPSPASSGSWLLDDIWQAEARWNGCSTGVNGCLSYGAKQPWGHPNSHRSRLHDHETSWLPSGAACLGARPRVPAEARLEHAARHDHATLTLVSLQENFKLKQSRGMRHTAAGCQQQRLPRA